MILELKFFRVRVGKLEEFVGLYEQQGLPIQMPAQDKFLGMYTTEFGPLNEVSMLWGYRNNEDRMSRRSMLAQKPEWRAFREIAAPLVLAEENRMLVPTPGSPVPVRWD
jgi:hypothetical protein